MQLIDNFNLIISAHVNKHRFSGLYSIDLLKCKMSLLKRNLAPSPELKNFSCKENESLSQTPIF